MDPDPAGDVWGAKVHEGQEHHRLEKVDKKHGENTLLSTRLDLKRLDDMWLPSPAQLDGTCAQAIMHVQLSQSCKQGRSGIQRRR